MIDALTREKIEELQGLAARATPGPWRCWNVSCRAGSGASDMDRKTPDGRA